MPSKSDPDWRRVKDRVPYHGKGVSDLIAALQRILLLPENKYAQKIVLETGTNEIYLEKMVPARDESGTELPRVSLHDVIRVNKMVEYDMEPDLTSAQQLWEMFAMVQHEGFEVCAIAAGDKAKFQKWLGVRIPQTDLRVFGTPFIIVGELPGDAFIVCGAPTRTAEHEDIRFSVKGTL